MHASYTNGQSLHYAYIHEMSPKHVRWITSHCSSLQDKTTMCSLQGTMRWEKWYECKPDYSYMREIGCHVFVLTQPVKKNPKVLVRSLECVLISYDKDSKTYWCYHREANRVMSSYHVVFAGPVRWTGKKTEIRLNPTAKDWTISCGCTNTEFFRLPVATFVKKSKNWEKPVFRPIMC